MRELVLTPRFERAFRRLVRKNPALQPQIETALRRMADNLKIPASRPITSAGNSPACTPVPSLTTAGLSLPDRNIPKPARKFCCSSTSARTKKCIEEIPPHENSTLKMVMLSGDAARIVRGCARAGEQRQQRQGWRRRTRPGITIPRTIHRRRMRVSAHFFSERSLGERAANSVTKKAKTCRVLSRTHAVENHEWTQISTNFIGVK